MKRMSMFNKNGRDTGTSPSPAPQGSSASSKRGMFSVLGPDVTITGNVSATADLHIDGRIDGDVACSNMVQGTESRITGSVKADVARLAGSVEGSVSVRQLTVERSARIAGDVEYETISIENGASIDGRLKHLSADSRGRVAHSASGPDISLVSSNGEAA